MALTLPLHTDRLTLRPTKLSDRDALLAIYADEGVARFLLDDPWTSAETAVQVNKRVQRLGLNTEQAALALVIEADGQVVGDVAMWCTDDTGQKVEIGWVIAPWVAGRGYATEAAGGLIRAAVPAYQLHRVEAQLDGRNDASARVCEKLGMRREAYLRQNWWSKGEWTDTLIYGLLASEVEED
ncbi:GNAT family protein [Ammonicoccus fulvus]|uniref:GNAT family protein n=1 Tax=Ammonicoccus fulvus TaxID=3138240 RepID=A0ABZ3FLF9_9ACTN